MKNILRTFIFAGAAVALLSSCEEEYPYQKVTPIDTPAAVSLTIDGVDEPIGLMAPKTKSYTIKIKAASIADDLLKFTIAADKDKVAEYNAANGTDYEMVPAEAYELSTTEFLLPRYNTVSSTATITLKASGLPDDGATRLLPITITKIEGAPETIMEAKDSTVYIQFYRKSLAGVKFEEGSGTEADPYIVRDHADMLAMINDLKSGETTYVRMEADVDMTELEEWMPVNAAEPYDKAVDFDGNGHVIKNLYSAAASMPSMFGVLTGKFCNVVFEDPVLDLNVGTSDAGAGLLAAKAVNAEISNVTVNGLLLNSTGGNNNNGKHLGGLVGIADGCTFDDIDVEVEFIDADGDGKMPRIAGGLVGMCTGNTSTFNDCHVKGSVYGHHYVGGLIGMLGADNATVTDCSADVDVKTIGNFGSGFIGYANKGLNVSGCHSTGTLSHSGNYHGGFIGTIQGEAMISRCWSGVEITNVKGTHVGAFIGNLGKGSSDCNDNKNLGNTTVEDCYATGSITVTQGSGNSGRMNSGFIAMIEKVSDVTIRRCYASGDVIANSNGPVAGLVAGAKTDKIADESINFTMSECIAWNGKIVSTPANATTWSSGAIIGVSNLTNTLKDNYRNPKMEYIEYHGETTWDVYDQENTSPSSPLAMPAENKAPYHGKAAPAGSTISSVAKMLGWSEDVWDLSGDAPVLR